MFERTWKQLNNKKIEQCFCQSYCDDGGILRDCTCGKCGKLKNDKLQQQIYNEAYNTWTIRPARV